MSMNDPNDKTKGTHGASTVQSLGEEKKKGGMGWLPWLLGALLLLGLLLLLMRGCSDDDRAASTTTTQQTTTTAPAAATAPVAPAATATAATPALAVESVQLPNGQTFQAAPNSLNYQLQSFLASPEPAPRSFEFENLNFATSSAELPADAQGTVTALSQILQAYPNARVRVDGYADARGDAGANQQLGAQRAESVARALIAAGVPAARITAASGGETNPVDSNTTAQGQAENRRTQLTVLSK